MLHLITSLKNSFVKTIIMISHNMDEISEFCDRVIVLNEGKLMSDSTPQELFADESRLAGTGLALPHTAHIRQLLADCGIQLQGDTLSANALAKAISRALGGAR